jgi:hypothetical protein
MGKKKKKKKLASSIVKAASSTYESELQNLILKQTGFHFSGNTAALSQLEESSSLSHRWAVKCTEKPNMTKLPLQVLAVAVGKNEKNKVWEHVIW